MCRTGLEICGWSAKNRVFVGCHNKPRSEKFPGPNWDTKTMPVFWPLILRGVGYGLDFFWAVSLISLTVKCVRHIHQPMGWARDGSGVFSSVVMVHSGFRPRVD